MASQPNLQPTNPRASSEPQARRVLIVDFPLTKPRLTFILLAIIIGIFVFQVIQIQTADRETLTAWGGLLIRRVQAGEWYRLFTHIFLHVDEVHLAFNGLALYAIGRLVEQLYGHAKFAAIYFLGGLGGGLAILFIERGNAIGASGAIFALIGAEAVFVWVNRAKLGSAAWDQLQSTGFVVLVSVASSIIAQRVPGATPISLWGHMGGLAVGVALGFLLTPRIGRAVVQTVPETETTL